jgi:hypothetical protein
MQRRTRQLLPSRVVALRAPAEHRLGALTTEESRLLRQPWTGGAWKAGIHRAIPGEVVQLGRWEALDDGRRLWRLALHSESALALRVHFTVFDLGNGRVWMHDGTGADSEIFGPYTGKGIHDDGEFWSDLVAAPVAVIEYEPGDGSETLPFRITEISHYSQLAMSGPASAAASCNLDSTCSPEWANTARSVALIAFERDGSSGVCSGTLLNTRNNSRIPYFLTADHCIDSETAARNVIAVWFYQSASCNAPPPSLRDVPRTQGSRYLAGIPFTNGDATLLRLNQIPDGVTFSGWTADPVEPDTRIVGVHHPRGDYKRVSFGVTRPATRFSGINASRFIGAFWNAGGLTEGGSSGSGLFLSDGRLIGMLSHGPKFDTVEAACTALPFADNYGSFSNFYPLIRDFLEERGTPDPGMPPPSGGPVALTSGQAHTFNLPAVTGGTLFTGSNSFRIDVPQGATRLEIRVTTSTPNADVDLFARFGQEPAVVDRNIQADHRSEGRDGNETIVITPTSNPALRAGTYFISLALFTTGVAVTGNITATVTGPTGPPPAGPVVLTSGQARSFSLPSVTTGTLFTGSNAFRIDVPQGATRLEIRITTSTPNADVDLFARFGQEPTVASGSIQADHRSEGPDGNETIIVTPTSSPALRAGTYFIALALFTNGVAVSGNITATVTAPGAPPPSGAVALTSGQSRSFSLPAVTGGTLFTGSNAYRIDVPQGAVRLDVRITTQTPGADVDLYVRFGEEPRVVSGSIQADHASESATGEEAVSVTSGSTPPLRAGTYFIALALFTNGTPVTGTITATVSTSSSPTTGNTILTSGQARTFSLPAVTSPALFRGASGFSINVPAGASRLEVRLASQNPGADVDLYVRAGSDVETQSGRIISDASSQNPGSNETVVISGTQLRAGSYFIAFVLHTPNTTFAGTITATVSTGQAPPPSEATTLTSGVAAPFRIGPVTSGTVFRGSLGFRIAVPEGATRLEIRLATTTPNADVDLYARNGQDVGIESGRVVADAVSDGLTGSESITLTPGSQPALQAGTYFIALGLFTNGVEAIGSVTATVTVAGSQQTPSASTLLEPGVPAKFSLGPVERPTLFSGNYSYRVVVPEGSGRLTIRLVSDTPSVDTDLYVRFGADTDVADGEIVSDYSGTSQFGNETIVIDPASQPALRAGTYYISVGLYTTGAAAQGTVTAVIERGSVQPPTQTGGILLQSERQAQFTLPAVERPTLFGGDVGFRVNVPANGSRLEVVIASNPVEADVDLHVRFGAEPVVMNSRIVADHSSTQASGEEQVIITRASSPPLRAGTYFISLSLWTTGVRVTGTISALVVTDTASEPLLTSADGTVSKTAGAELQPLSWGKDGAYPAAKHSPAGHADGTAALKKRVRRGLAQ